MAVKIPGLMHFVILLWKEQGQDPDTNTGAFASRIKMTDITIHDLEHDISQRLQIRATAHGRSIEEEIRQILRESLASESGDESNLAERLRRRFQPLGGVELPELKREPIREPLDFGNDRT